MANPGGKKPDDDATKVIYRKGENTQETQIMTERGGGAPAGAGGRVIGVANIHQGVRVAGHPAPGQPAPKTGPVGGGETVFLPAQAGTTQPGQAAFDPVVGWLVVVDGPGRGLFRHIHYGQNSIGRGTDLRVTIDFGDQRISRDAHAFIIYDENERRYYIRDNGKSSMVRHNGNLVMQPAEIFNRDFITIGETTLLFIALCDNSFDWFDRNASQQS